MVTLEELLTDTPFEDPTGPEFTASAARITTASRAHASEITSFEELNLAEIGGFFDIHREELCLAFAQMHALTERNAKPATAEDFRRNEQVFVNVFFEHLSVRQGGHVLANSANRRGPARHRALASRPSVSSVRLL